MEGSEPTRGAGEEYTEDISHFSDLDVCLNVIEDIQAGVEPKSFTDAIGTPDQSKWMEALRVEYEQHVKNKTLGPPIPLPTGFKAIPLDVILKIKRNGVYKARAVVKGFHMTSGIDYNETFSPVANITTLRVLLALAAKYDWEVKQGDVHTAFLGAEMDTEVYVRVPNWFSTNPFATGFSHRRLTRAIPGIPQGPRLWYRKLHKIITERGLKQCECDYALYYDDHCILVVWVDDFFLFYPTRNEARAQKLWKELQKEMELDDYEDIHDCLGCVVVRDRKRYIISLSQQKPITKLLQRAGLENCSSVDTPMVAGSYLSKSDCPNETEKLSMADEQTTYRSILAAIIYVLTWTRPDISFAVSKLCRFMHNPGHKHLQALKRLLRYLHGTSSYGLVYSFEKPPLKSGVYGYYDASHADCTDTRRSTLAYYFFFEGCPISWNSKLHSYITTSTNHSEYCGAAKAAKEAKWLDSLYSRLSFLQFIRPIHLFSDSKGAIAMAYNPAHRAASKHVDLADHYAREQQERGTIAISYVPTKNMIADIGTKPLAATAFKSHAEFLVKPLG